MNYLAKLALIAIPGVFSLAAQGPPPGGFGGGFGGPGGPGMGRGGPREKVVTGLPYSGVITTQRTQTSSDGNQISNQSETKVYRDTEGRVRRDTTRTSPSGQSETFIELFDPVAGFTARLNPEKLTAFKHMLPAKPPAESDEPPSHPDFGGGPQRKTDDLGTKTFDGLVATGKQITMTMPAGERGNDEAVQMVREVWTSTALKVPVYVVSTDPHFGKSTMQLGSVSQSEPDASLFQIPANYKVSTKAPHSRPPDQQ